MFLGVFGPGEEKPRMFDPYAVKAGACVDVEDMSARQLQDAQNKLARRNLILRGNQVCEGIVLSREDAVTVRVALGAKIREYETLSRQARECVGASERAVKELGERLDGAFYGWIKERA